MTSLSASLAIFFERLTLRRTLFRHDSRCTRCRRACRCLPWSSLRPGGVSDAPTVATRNVGMFVTTCQAEPYETWRRGWDSQHLVEFARQSSDCAALLPSLTRHYGTSTVDVKARRAQNFRCSRHPDVRKRAQKVLDHRPHRVEQARAPGRSIRFPPPPPHYLTLYPGGGYGKVR